MADFCKFKKYKLELDNNTYIEVESKFDIDTMTRKMNEETFIDFVGITIRVMDIKIIMEIKE